MATGYTCDILDGIDFKTYALNCARAFGACVTLRDEPGGGDKIPDSFEPSDYHLKAAEKVRKKLDELEAMPLEELMALRAKELEEEKIRRLEYAANQQKQREKYEAMLEKVKAWTPPTPEHEALHRFMVSQIEESIRSDCPNNDPTAGFNAADWTADWTESWARKRYEDLTRDLQYHEQGYEKEKQSAATRTAWVRALKASL